MKGQKEAVIENLLKILPSFEKYKHSALEVLSSSELETLKNVIFLEIVNGHIEYGKDRSNNAEVRTYARSMVMNHLKKSKELNGGVSYNPTPRTEEKQGSRNSVKTIKPIYGPKGVNMTLLPEELQEFLIKLV